MPATWTKSNHRNRRSSRIDDGRADALSRDQLMTSPIPPNPPRWTPAADPASIVVPGLDTNAPVNDQVDQIEQLITIKLQVGTIVDQTRRRRTAPSEYRCQLLKDTKHTGNQTPTGCEALCSQHRARARGRQGGSYCF